MFLNAHLHPFELSHDPALSCLSSALLLEISKTTSPLQANYTMVVYTDLQTQIIVLNLMSMNGTTSTQIAQLTGLKAWTVRYIYKGAISRGFQPQERPLVIKDEHLADRARGYRNGRQRQGSEASSASAAARASARSARYARAALVPLAPAPPAVVPLVAAPLSAAPLDTAPLNGSQGAATFTPLAAASPPPTTEDPKEEDAPGEFVDDLNPMMQEVALRPSRPVLLPFGLQYHA